MKPNMKKVALIPIIIIFALTSFMAGLIFVYAEEPEEQVFYYLHNHLGGIEAILDEEGNVVERRDYLPFGKTREEVITETEHPKLYEDYGYTGKELDNETGLYYYGSRYYDPEIGRFTQIDPLVLGESDKPLESILKNPQALNSYSYALNNPMKYVDEEGEYSKEIHYDLTYFLASKSGLSLGQSKVIAYRNQYVDENPDTSPSPKNWLNDPAKVERYHFRTRKEGIEIIESAIASKSSPAVGDALHTYQDTYSHEGLTPWGHIKLGTAPDKTYLNHPKAYEMAKQTFFYLRKFNRLTNGLDDLTPAEYRKKTVEIWRENKNEISAYLWLKDKTGTKIEKEARESEKEDN